MQYKHIEKRIQGIPKNLSKLISEKEQKIAELEQLLAIMGN